MIMGPDSELARENSTYGQEFQAEVRDNSPYRNIHPSAETNPPIISPGSQLAREKNTYVQTRARGRSAYLSPETKRTAFQQIHPARGDSSVKVVKTEPSDDINMEYSSPEPPGNGQPIYEIDGVEVIVTEIELLYGNLLNMLRTMVVNPKSKQVDTARDNMATVAVETGAIIESDRGPMREWLHSRVRP